MVLPIVSTPTSVTFQQDREGTLYVGTTVTLTCTVSISVDRTLVDTDITVTFNYVNLPSDASRVITSTTASNFTTHQGVVEFRFLLPSDGGVTYGCESTVEPVENGVPVTSPMTTLTLQVEGEPAGCMVYACIVVQVSAKILFQLKTGM